MVCSLFSRQIISIQYNYNDNYTRCKLTEQAAQFFTNDTTHLTIYTSLLETTNLVMRKAKIIQTQNTPLALMLDSGLAAQRVSQFHELFYFSIEILFIHHPEMMVELLLSGNLSNLSKA